MVVFRVWRQGRRPEWGATLRSNVRRLLRRVQRPESPVFYFVRFLRMDLKGRMRKRPEWSFSAVAHRASPTARIFTIILYCLGWTGTILKGT